MGCGPCPFGPWAIFRRRHCPGSPMPNKSPSAGILLLQRSRGLLRDGMHNLFSEPTCGQCDWMHKLLSAKDPFPGLISQASSARSRTKMNRKTRNARKMAQRRVQRIFEQFLTDRKRREAEFVRTLIEAAALQASSPTILIFPGPSMNETTKEDPNAHPATD